MRADTGPLWDAIVQKYGLRPRRYEPIVSGPVGEFLSSLEYDVTSDTTEARHHAFHEAVDPDEMFDRRFRTPRDQRSIS